LVLASDDRAFIETRGDDKLTKTRVRAVCCAAWAKLAAAAGICSIFVLRRGFGAEEKKKEEEEKEEKKLVLLLAWIQRASSVRWSPS
jgi:hypothetical protein